MKNLLEFVEGPETSFKTGIIMSMMLFCSEFARLSCYALMYGISIRSSTRTLSGLSSHLYVKLLNCKSLSNKSTGEVRRQINFLK